MRRNSTQHKLPCDKCGHLDSKTISTVYRKVERSVHRLRVCYKCSSQFTTYEVSKEYYLESKKLLRIIQETEECLRKIEKLRKMGLDI